MALARICNTGSCALGGGCCTDCRLQQPTIIGLAVYTYWWHHMLTDLAYVVSLCTLHINGDPSSYKLPYCHKHDQKRQCYFHVHNYHVLNWSALCTCMCSKEHMFEKGNPVRNLYKPLSTTAVHKQTKRHIINNSYPTQSPLTHI